MREDAPYFFSIYFKNCSLCLHIKKNAGKGANAPWYCRKYRFYFSNPDKAICNGF